MRFWCCSVVGLRRSSGTHFGGVPGHDRPGSPSSTAVSRQLHRTRRVPQRPIAPRRTGSAGRIPPLNPPVRPSPEAVFVSPDAIPPLDPSGPSCLSIERIPPPDPPSRFRPAHRFGPVRRIPPRTRLTGPNREPTPSRTSSHARRPREPLPEVRSAGQASQSVSPTPAGGASQPEKSSRTVPPRQSAGPAGPRTRQPGNPSGPVRPRQSAGPARTNSRNPLAGQALPEPV